MVFKQIKNRIERHDGAIQATSEDCFSLDINLGELPSSITNFYNKYFC